MFHILQHIGTNNCSTIQSQVLIQTMLLDVTHRLRPQAGGNLPYLDLSSMLYNKESTWSKATYFVLYISSTCSIIVSFARILTWGDQPIITSFLSFRFLKISLFLITKLITLSYVQSSITTMLIWGQVRFLKVMKRMTDHF